MRFLRVLNLGLKDYLSTYQLQKELVRYRANQQIPDTLILVEHPPVITIGRNGTRDNILVTDELLATQGIKVYEIDRGGDITYHGPGQIVGYPILDLNEHGKDLHKLLHMYEEVIIQVLDHYGIHAGRIKEYPGVWVGSNKIAALGIGVSRWVSYHGFAFNINPNMLHFQMITPCGITGKGITSLNRELGREVDITEVQEKLVDCFCSVFGLGKEKD